MKFEIPSETLINIFDSYELRHFSQDIDYLERCFENEQTLIEQLLSCQQSGIRSEDLATRRACYGINLIKQKQPPTFLQLYFQSYQSFPIRLLLILSLLLIIVSSSLQLRQSVDWVQGIAIFIAIQISILVSVFNNLHKVRTFIELTKNYEALKRVTVIRDGEEVLMHPREIVVGDICLLDESATVNCDGILLEGGKQGRAMVVDQGILGRHQPAVKVSLATAIKQRERLPEQNMPKDRNIIPSPVLIGGTTVAKGSGKMLVLAVGQNLHRSRVQLPEQQMVTTPLQTDLLNISSQLSFYGKVSASILVIVMLSRFGLYKLETHDWNSQYDLPALFEIVLLGSCILVLSVPEGLPLSVTISIAYSLNNIAKDNNLVRNIGACETIGLVTDLCLDKDGLLVQERLKANYFFSFEMEGMLELGEGFGTSPPHCSAYYRQQLGLCLSNKVSLQEGRWFRIQQALNELAHTMSYQPSMTHNLTRHSSELTRAVISIRYTRKDSKKMNYIKGHQLKLLEVCQYVYDDGKVLPITTSYKEDIRRAASQIERKGEAVVMLCYNQGKGVVFLALVGIQEHPRPDVLMNLEKLKASGIHSYIIVKEGRQLCEVFFQQIGYVPEDNCSQFIDGKVFLEEIGGLICRGCRVAFCDCPYDILLAQKMGMEHRVDTVANKEGFRRIISNLVGLYNCSAEEKYALVVGLRDLGKLIAVTSRSYQDKLTLQSADVGFVMNGSYKCDLGVIGGINMLESSLDTIIKSILWGRNVVSSVQKFLVFHLTANMVAIGLTLYGSVLWQEGILRPVHLLWINLLIDNLAAMALATEPRGEQLSDKNAHYQLISRKMLKRIVVIVIYQLLVLVIVYTIGERFLPQFVDDYDIYLLQNKRDPFVNKYNEDRRPNLLMRSGRRYTFDGSPDYSVVYDDLGLESRHLTFVFNLFVVLQIFNFISCRKVHKDGSIMEFFRKNGTFLIVVTIVLVAQYLLITFGGVAIQVYSFKGLSIFHWLISLAFGVVQLGISAVVNMKLENEESSPDKDIAKYKMRSERRTPANMPEKIHTKLHRDLLSI